ncbi:hexokinase family protein [Desulforamulus ruminis]|uniref:Hexokinase n=1 Tax=Desulforamulus ruminis (strain ATCC 23193 / DSM 2154 / NCIMB 8452 / DL) TaxID=696281 RepID=F6DSS5_DESRL|nr:hexokinase [Desulforamulus ruminis]AEG58894.1 Hexokinase [Desulforamulus ruminis DSM 2154]
MNPKTLVGQLEYLKTLFLNLDLLALARNFQQEMMAGSGGNSSLKMLPTFLNKPVGQETGTFFSIDFGGTNVRLQIVQLLGRGLYEIKQSRSFLLIDPSGLYNYTSKQTTAADLFDFIAHRIKEMIDPGSTYLLGHTFSFPCRQLDANRAVLINWTKEFNTAGVEGHEVTGLLEQALHRNHMVNIKPVAIINDTTATLLTASYANPRAHIGSICGTGHNTCYIEPKDPLTGQSMIINLESGNFNKIPLTPFDSMLDQSSEDPGQQFLEKAVSGRYIGEIVRLILGHLISSNLLFFRQIPDFMERPHSIKAVDLSCFLEDRTPHLEKISQWLNSNWGIFYSSLEERQALKTVAALVTARSAQLVAATYIGILQQIDPELRSDHIIAVDGTLFEKMNSFTSHVQEILTGFYSNCSHKVTLKLTRGGSGVGAAIAAATTLHDGESSKPTV